jgi:predicted aspartyl protease
VAVTGDRLVSSRFPYLPLHLEVRLRELDLEALLDTGFDGDIAVPGQLITSPFPPDGYLHWTLADGAEVLTPYYFGTIELEQLASLDVVVVALGDEALVGIGVASQFSVLLDHGMRVIVEP